MPDADRLAHKWVKFVLRSEMMKHDVTYNELARRLTEIGVVESSGALRNRASRGRFSAAFLFQCLAVVGTRNVNVELNEYIRHARTKSTESSGVSRNGSRQLHMGRATNHSARNTSPNRH